MQYPTINMKLTGENIARLRDEHNYSVNDLQREFGFSSPVAIYKWQSGKTLPSVDNLVILSVLFKTPIDDILVCNGGRDVVCTKVCCQERSNLILHETAA